MQKLAHFLKTPFYFQWLIVFFALNSYSDYIGHVPLADLLLLIGKVSIAGWALFFLTNFLYKNKYKSALFVSVMLFSYLFFGALQDHLRLIKPLAALAHIRLFFLFTVTVCVLVFTGLFFYKKNLLRLTNLLNLLFLIYVVYDLGAIAWKTGRAVQENNAIPTVTVAPVPDTTKRPDIYFILLDEYLGSDGLKNYFHYDNSGFETFLQQRGFYVCNKPVSNYSYTVYSMASLFNMGYIDSFVTKKKQRAYEEMISQIDHNKTWSYLHQLQYRINNLSPFVIDGQQPKRAFNLVPAGIELIADKTAYNRVVKYLPYGDVLTDYRLHGLSKLLYKQLDDDNESMMAAALATPKDTTPTFTYLHLILPHRPYMYDSTGQWSFTKQYKGDKVAVKDSLYLNYLVYANKRISRFIDQLHRQTNGNAAIVLMSDHGYRSNSQAPDALRFSTLNAVYLPGRNYQLWYNGVSNVNQFPLLFNTLFKQQLPLQKDSCKF